MGEQNQRFICGPASALRSWLLTNVLTPNCLCEPFSCKACSGTTSWNPTPNQSHYITFDNSSDGIFVSKRFRVSDSGSSNQTRNLFEFQRGAKSNLKLLRKGFGSGLNARAMAGFWTLDKVMRGMSGNTNTICFKIICLYLDYTCKHQ